MEPGKVGTSDGAGGVAGPGPPHRAAAPRHSPARGLSGPHSWRLARRRVTLATSPARTREL